VKRDFDELDKPTFDLIVVGGGIVGTGIARDASLRGLRTLLLEKEDFACGTTSRSSRLIHGGLRYLRHLDLHLVRQDMREREVLLKIAPHLVHPLPFVLPLASPLARGVMALGMRLYDLLSFDKTLPSHRYLSRRETLELEPGLALARLSGSYLFYDCQVAFAERLCLENALSATEHGAFVINHAKVTGLVNDGSAVTGVQV
jgi:glycerol-3-phosphate dehydrogenase